MARVYHLRPGDLRALTVSELGAFHEDLNGRGNEERAAGG